MLIKEEFSVLGGGMENFINSVWVLIEPGRLTGSLTFNEEFWHLQTKEALFLKGRIQAQGRPALMVGLNKQREELLMWYL